MSRRLLAGALLLLGAITVIIALRELTDAYAWVSHTSDVRIAIGKSIGATTALGDPRACDILTHGIDDIGELTVDNHSQQARVEVLRSKRAAACSGDVEAVAAVGRRLIAADSAERDLLDARRKRLNGTATVSVAIFLSTMVLAMIVAAGSAYARSRAMATLAESEERFRLLAESATDLIRAHEAMGKVLYVTPSCRTLLGVTEEEVLSAPPLAFTHPDEVDKVRAFIASLSRRESPAPFRHRLRMKDGTFRWFETQARAVFDPNGTMVRYYTAARDIDKRVEVERKLEALTLTDELTGLHNRRGFTLLAGHEHQLAARQGRGLVLVYLDLDGLKPINDELGHEQGDAAIRDFAAILRGTFRASDIVARMGGDEFAALTYDVPEADAKVIVSRLRAALDAFNAKHERPFELAASVGLATMQPGVSRTLEELIASADARMYDQKRERGRGVKR